MHSVDKLILRGVSRLSELDAKARKAAETQPKVGEVMYERKRDARTAFNRNWQNMTPEQRQNELATPGRVQEIMELMGGGDG
jgi:hypothetical protein|tara:strand:+ start:2988 stop:3233 length:246 start_codon:yes stop_codon:yes gene_type:complete